MGGKDYDYSDYDYHPSTVRNYNFNSTVNVPNQKEEIEKLKKVNDELSKKNTKLELDVTELKRNFEFLSEMFKDVINMLPKEKDIDLGALNNEEDFQKIIKINEELVKKLKLEK